MSTSRESWRRASTPSSFPKQKLINSCPSAPETLRQWRLPLVALRSPAGGVATRPDGGRGRASRAKHAKLQGRDHRMAPRPARLGTTCFAGTATSTPTSIATSSARPMTDGRYPTASRQALPRGYETEGRTPGSAPALLTGSGPTLRFLRFCCRLGCRRCRRLHLPEVVRLDPRVFHIAHLWVEGKQLMLRRLD